MCAISATAGNRPWPASRPTPPTARRKPVKTGPPRIPEWRLQAEVVGELRRALDVYAADGKPAPFLFAGDMNAARRGVKAAGIAKATGMEAGEPDLRFYLPSGATRLVELKAAGGRLTDAQKQRHSAFAALGHDVLTVQANTPQEARNAIVALVDGWTAGAISAVRGRMALAMARKTTN